jgi:hypothetical protein
VRARDDASRAVQEFLSGQSDLAALARWVQVEGRAVYAGRDDAARELVDKARMTIDAVVRARVPPERAREHLRDLLAPPPDRSAR